MFFKTVRLLIVSLVSGFLFVLPGVSRHSEATAQERESGFKIAENGRARAVIVTGKEPLPAVVYAVNELQWHIEKSTGICLNVITEDTVDRWPHAGHIYVGNSQAASKRVTIDKLTANSFSLLSKNNALFLVGHDDNGRENGLNIYSGQWKDFKQGELPLDDSASMGSLFAVYEWLEKQMGVKWLWPDESGVVIDEKKVLFSGTYHQLNVKPALLFSQARLNTWAGMDETQKPRYVYNTSVWLRRHRFARSIGRTYGGHSFRDYWQRFGETHPEYFAMLPNGKREPYNLQRPNLAQMCVSNPDFHKQVVADWLDSLKNNPSLTWVNAGQNDVTAMGPPCQCDNCKAWDPKPAQPMLVKENPWLSGHPVARKDTTWERNAASDREAKYWLAVQKEAQKHDPDAKVTVYAYATTSDPPVETRLNKNIIVGIVPAYNYPMSEAEQSEFRRVWDGWVATGATVYLRPNNFLTGYGMPFMYPTQIGNDFKHALNTGIIGTDFDSLVGMWGVQGINWYVIGRLTAHPEMSVEDILSEYYSAFGSAASDIKKYFEHWEEVTKKAVTAFQRAANGGWSPLSREGDVVYTPETFARGKELLQQARQTAGTDQEVLARIDFLNMWLEHADLTMNTLTAFKSYRDKPADAQLRLGFEEAKIALDDYRGTHADKIVNIGFLHYLEGWWRKWKAPATTK